MRKNLSYIILISFGFTLASCNSNTSPSSCIQSPTTGWPYDFKVNHAFKKVNLPLGRTPTNMAVIPGWTFTVDDVDEFETVNRRIRPNETNIRRDLSVNSFYMDRYEVRNIDWREYLTWLSTVYTYVNPNRIENAKPDINAWTEGLSDNEPFMFNYFTHPSFNEYPVVCVSWDQVSDYCKWRTDRSTEFQLIKYGAIKAPNFDSIANLTSLDEVEHALFSSERFFSSIDDNILNSCRGLFPDYRLPSEDEWEFAAYARKSSDPDNVVKIYPWSEKNYEVLSKSRVNQQQAHYNQSRTNIHSNMFSRTVPVGSFAPNDFGLYNMAGNVNEWVLDRYVTRSGKNKIDSVDILDIFLPEYHKSPDSRVYKGGSWKDPIYWLHPASRRYLDRNKSANDIGFRCVTNLALEPGSYRRAEIIGGDNKRRPCW